MRSSFSRHAHRAGFGAQTSSSAIRAGRITTEAAEKYPHMQLVFLAFQPVEKPLDALVVVLRIAFENQPALLPGYLTPPHVPGTSTRPHPFLCFLQNSPVAC